MNIMPDLEQARKKGLSCEQDIITARLWVL